MTPILNLLIISVLCVFVIDYSGFVDEIGDYLTKITRSKLPLKLPKPFNCSLCSTLWVGLFYLLIINQLTFINLLFLVCVCCLTGVILHLIYAVTGFIDRIIFLFEHLTGQDQ